MKRITIFTLFITLLCGLYAGAQTQKFDKVLKVNGDELTGKVTEVNPEDIKFVFSNETLVYTFKKTDIQKITFASGRVQVFNQPSLPSENTPPAQSESEATVQQASAALPASTADHHNKVAVLPFAFLKDGQEASDALSEVAQEETASMMRKHAGTLEIIDPSTTNAYLLRNNIDRYSIKKYTMDEICNMLGVEYVVQGTVSVNPTTQTNSTSGYSTTKSKDEGKSNNEHRRTSSSSSSSYSTQNYQTSILIKMFSDKGQTIYNRERTSFWNTQDAYKSALDYLLKRSPLYTK